MKKIIMFFIISPLFLAFSGNVLYSTLFEGNTIQENVLADTREWEFNYEATIWYIKQHEGFNNGYAYVCDAGYKTIGYGHVVKPSENFMNDRITKSQADSLLRLDFNQSIALVEKYTSLTGSKKLAIAHFVYSKGIGNFLRSRLKQKIDNNEPIDNEILKWCFYQTPDGRTIKSSYSFKIRQWELQMYNSK